jgi:hypothetical protein
MNEPRTKRAWWRWAAWLLAPACLLAAGEWGLRRGGYEYTRLADRVLQVRSDIDESLAPGSGLYRFDTHELWSPRPGASLPWANDEHINADGYRGPALDVEREKGKLRIAFLGGSATMGVGVRWDDTFSALAPRFLSESGHPAEGLNAGVEGFSVRQCLERYRDLVRPYRPHVVVLSIAFTTSYRQAEHGWTDDQLIRRARLLDADPTRLRGDWPSSRLLQFAHWFKDALDGRYWADRDFEFQQMRMAGSAGNLEWGGARRVPVDDYYYSLSWLLQETRQDGAHLVLLSIPSAPGAAIPPVVDVYQRTVNDFADREKLILLDGRNAYLEALRDDIPKEDLFQSDLFPSECGHLQLAQALADTIKSGIEKRATTGAGGSTPRKQ